MPAAAIVIDAATTESGALVEFAAGMSRRRGANPWKKLFLSL
jgi:hypothetical protein